MVSSSHVARTCIPSLNAIISRAHTYQEKCCRRAVERGTAYCMGGVSRAFFHPCYPRKLGCCYCKVQRTAAPHEPSSANSRGQIPHRTCEFHGATVLRCSLKIQTNSKCKLGLSACPQHVGARKTQPNGNQPQCCKICPWHQVNDAIS